MTAAFLLPCCWASSWSGEDWGLAPASPLILVWPQSSYVAASLTLFVCKMETVTIPVDVGIEWGSPRKKSSNSHYLTQCSHLNRAGGWWPHRTPSRNILLSQWAPVILRDGHNHPGGQGKKIRLQKLIAKTNPNLHNQKITLGPNPHCPCDCVWNSPPSPVRGLCKVPALLSLSVPWHVASAYEQHVEAGVTCSQKLSELVQAFSLPIQLVQQEGRHGHPDTQLMLLLAE